MLPHEISPQVTAGLWSVLAAVVSGLLSWLGGGKMGERKGEARFINAVREAASFAIEELNTRAEQLQTMHQECLAKHGECEVKVENLQMTLDNIMSGKVPLYNLGAADMTKEN